MAKPPYTQQEEKYFRFEPGVITTENWRLFNEAAFEVILKGLGRSTTGEVDLLVHKKSGFVGAMKVVKSNRRREIDSETEHLLIARDCPFLLRLVDGFTLAEDPSDRKPIRKFSTCMLLEYAPFRTLDELCLSVRGIPSVKVKFYAMEIAKGLKYLHEKKIMHRDVKPENMFLRANGHVALGDFGQTMPGEPGSCTICATQATRPPEVWNNMIYSMPVDIWMFGTSIYFMIACSWPFLSAYKDKQKDIVMAGIFDDRMLCPDLTDLLHLIFVPVPSLRPTASDILQHRYITSLEQSSVPPYSPAELFNALSVKYTEEEKQIIKKLIPTL